MKLLMWCFVIAVICVMCDSSFADEYWEVDGDKLVLYKDGESKRFEELTFPVCGKEFVESCIKIENNRAVIYENTAAEKLQEVEFPSGVIDGATAIEIIVGTQDNPYRFLEESVEGSEMLDFGSPTLTKLEDRRAQHLKYDPETMEFRVGEIETVTSVVASSDTDQNISSKAFVFRYVMQLCLFGVFMWMLFSEYSFAPITTNERYARINDKWIRIFFEFRGLSPNSRIALVILLLVGCIYLTQFTIGLSGGIIATVLIIGGCSMLAGFFAFCAEKVLWEGVIFSAIILCAFFGFVTHMNASYVTNYLTFFTASAVMAWFLANLFYFAIKYILLRNEKK
ncbi:hypothetical protein ACFL16_00745 [Patescibacteria group bacterium]